MPAGFHALHGMNVSPKSKLVLNPPDSDSTPHGSLCPWKQLEWFHLSPGKTDRQTGRSITSVNVPYPASLTNNIKSILN